MSKINQKFSWIRNKFNKWDKEHENFDWNLKYLEIAKTENEITRTKELNSELDLNLKTIKKENLVWIKDKERGKYLILKIIISNLNSLRQSFLNKWRINVKNLIRKEMLNKMK